MTENIETFRNMLMVDRHRLDDELETQAAVMDRITDRLATLGAHATDREDEFKRAEAAAFARAQEGEKVSIKAAELAARTDAARVLAWSKSVAARHEVERWRGLLDAWKARGFAIRDLVTLYTAQYFTVDSRSGVARPQIVRHDYSRDRAGHTEAGLTAQPSRARRRVTV